MQPFVGVVARLLSVLESVISKLARYDEGSILGSILSFTVRGESLYRFSFFFSTVLPSLLFILLPLSALFVEFFFPSLSSFYICACASVSSSSPVCLQDHVNAICLLSAHVTLSLSFSFSSSLPLLLPCPSSAFSLFHSFCPLCCGLCNWWQYKQNVSGSGRDLGQAYVNFTRNCMDQIRGKVNDELWILNLFDVSQKIPPSVTNLSTHLYLIPFIVIAGLVWRADQNVGNVAGR